jgi:acetyl-CoA carboxylase biotin carboxyl carrier protein
MNMKEVKDLIQEILQSDISEFELEHTGTKLKLRRGAPQAHTSSASMPVASYAPPPTVPPMVLEHTTSPAAVAAEESDEEGLHLITSPIVGTFYRSPSPGTEAYVKIGQMVDEGTTLCIVEAMKLMNEIPSDVAGEVTRIYVENGSPVEFGQKLFGIRARR